MKGKFFSILMAAVILAACTALFWGGSYVAFILAYVFAFGLVLCYAGFSTTAAGEKAKQGLIFALIMAAQILFAVLVLRTLMEGDMTDYNLGRLAGVALVFVPFLVRRCVFQR